MEKVFDIHIHYLFDIPLKKTIEIFKKEFEYTKTEKGCFLSVPHEVKDGVVNYDEMQNIKALSLKDEFCPNFYAFGGLIHPQTHTDEKTIQKDFLQQVERLFAVGYDGMKMLEGYPSLLKAWEIPLDSKIYDSYYAFMEENGYSIIMHIANPNENWDIDKAGEYAIQAGRVYDKTYPTKSEITSQMFGIMKKFPKLKLILAHCGFFSQEKDNAERFMGDYENTMLDITPGGEQLLTMSKDWEYWLNFIKRYQSKFLYGTDFYAFPDENYNEWKTAFLRRPQFVRQFFETNERHTYIDEEFYGRKIDGALLKKIYWSNAERIMGLPKKIDKAYICKEAERILQLPKKQSQYADEDLKYILEKSSN